MMRLRDTWISIAALAAYLAVHVGVAALHHHAEASRTSSEARCCAVVSPATEDDGDEHACPVCHVLHLAQHVGPLVSPLVPGAASDETVIPSPAARPHSLETSTHARAPPTV